MTTRDVDALPGTDSATGCSAARGSRLRRFWQRLREGGALMVGVPDYDRYRTHMQAHHPDLVPLTRQAFVRNRMQARYGGSGTGKCPC